MTIWFFIISGSYSIPAYLILTANQTDLNQSKNMCIYINITISKIHYYNKHLINFYEQNRQQTNNAITRHAIPIINNF